MKLTDFPVLLQVQDFIVDLLLGRLGEGQLGLKLLLLLVSFLSQLHSKHLLQPPVFVAHLPHSEW